MPSLICAERSVSAPIPRPTVLVSSRRLSSAATANDLLRVELFDSAECRFGSSGGHPDAAGHEGVDAESMRAGVCRQWDRWGRGIGWAVIDVFDAARFEFSAKSETDLVRLCLIDVAPLLEVRAALGGHGETAVGGGSPQRRFVVVVSAVDGEGVWENEG